MEREIANCKVDQCPVVVASPGSLLSAFSIIMPCPSYGMKLYLLLHASFALNRRHNQSPFSFYA